MEKTRPLRDIIVAFAQANGLKVYSWARKAGIAKSTMYYFLNGKSHSLEFQTIERLADAAGVSLAVLLGEPRRPHSAVKVDYITNEAGALVPAPAHMRAPNPLPGYHQVSAVALKRAVEPFNAGAILYVTRGVTRATVLVNRLCVARMSDGIIRIGRAVSYGGVMRLKIGAAPPLRHLHFREAHRIVFVWNP